jgi:hypothetical protein
MLRLVWVDGRLAWPLVGLVVYLTATLILMDYAWRVMQMQFDTLMLYGLAIAGLPLVIAVALLLQFRPASRRRCGARHRTFSPQ